jgi:hypothetical protein
MRASLLVVFLSTTKQILHTVFHIPYNLSFIFILLRDSIRRAAQKILLENERKRNGRKTSEKRELDDRDSSREISE